MAWCWSYSLGLEQFGLGLGLEVYSLRLGVEWLGAGFTLLVLNSLVLVLVSKSLTR